MLRVRGISIISRIFIAFAMLFVMGISWYIKDSKDFSKLSNGDTVNFNTLRKNDWYDGLYVEGDVWYCLGQYAYEYTSSYGTSTNTTDYYYLLQVWYGDSDDDYYFTTLHVKSAAMVSILETISDETWDYYAGDIDDSYDFTSCYITGRVDKLDSEIGGYLTETLMDMGYTSSEASTLCTDYEIYYTDIEIAGRGYEMSGVCILIGFVGMFLIIGYKYILPKIMASRAERQFGAQSYNAAPQSDPNNIFAQNTPPSYSQPQSGYVPSPSPSASQGVISPEDQYRMNKLSSLNSASAAADDFFADIGRKNSSAAPSAGSVPETPSAPVSSAASDSSSGNSWEMDSLDTSALNIGEDDL